MGVFDCQLWFMHVILKRKKISLSRKDDEYEGIIKTDMRKQTT